MAGQVVDMDVASGGWNQLLRLSLAKVGLGASFQESRGAEGAKMSDQRMVVDGKPVGGQPTHYVDVAKVAAARRETLE